MRQMELISTPETSAISGGCAQTCAAHPACSCGRPLPGCALHQLTGKHTHHHGLPLVVQQEESEALLPVFKVVCLPEPVPQHVYLGTVARSRHSFVSRLAWRNYEWACKHFLELETCGLA